MNFLFMKSKTKMLFAKQATHHQDIINNCIHELEFFTTVSENDFVVQGLHYNYGDHYPHFDIRKAQCVCDLHCYVSFDIYGYPHIIEVT